VQCQVEPRDVPVREICKKKKIVDAYKVNLLRVFT
jgi:hypothetical protein